jgi:hypothetical protein
VISPRAGQARSATRAQAIRREAARLMPSGPARWRRPARRHRHRHRVAVGQPVYRPGNQTIRWTRLWFSGTWRTTINT